MSRRSKILVSKSLYQMAIGTLVISVIWVMFAVASAWGEPANVEVPKEILEPLTPVIDTEVVEEMAKKRQMSESDWAQLSRAVAEFVKEGEGEVAIQGGSQQETQIPVVNEVVVEEASGSAVAQP